MKTQKLKIIKCKPYTKRDFDRDYQKMLKRSVMFSTDFQKIEDAPRSKFDKEVQERIAVVPSACDLLIDKETQELLEKALSSIHLSYLDRACLELAVEGLEPMAISRRLNITRWSARIHLERAKNKLKDFLREQML